MYSNRFRKKVREYGTNRNVPDWMVFACWIANNRLIKSETKFVGD